MSDYVNPNDIVQRLRIVADAQRRPGSGGNVYRTTSEAADEIERLRGQLAKACAYLREVGDDYPSSSCQMWCRLKAKECEL